MMISIRLFQYDLWAIITKYRSQSNWGIRYTVSSSSNENTSPFFWRQYHPYQPPFPSYNHISFHYRIRSSIVYCHLNSDPQITESNALKLLTITPKKTTVSPRTLDKWSQKTVLTSIDIFLGRLTEQYWPRSEINGALVGMIINSSL